MAQLSIGMSPDSTVIQRACPVSVFRKCVSSRVSPMRQLQGFSKTPVAGVCRYASMGIRIDGIDGNLHTGQ